MEALFATSFMSNLDVPDRWIKVAAMIPGKTVADVIKQYRELEEDVFDIESGRVPIPGYLTSEMVDHHDSDAYGKRSSGVKGPDHERKKGVPWTEEEHRRFLMGLMKYGKGEWRNISRNFVISKTPTQVASHAQNTGFSHNQSAHGLALKQKRPGIRKSDGNDYVSVMALEGDRFTSAERYQASNGLRFEGQNLHGSAQSSVF
ncbi:Transcription factor DIVARICATA [Hibiscus syriacus]|uniref:Transcription factor DIVARICATA n=1 Tax=Hibiscus syriacus TaxID=106335 RepID=A0A6A2WSJ6_HIBSY|nr:Transcription factor DIVARICATA [Hibiscus syriacus]